MPLVLILGSPTLRLELRKESINKVVVLEVLTS